MAQAYIGLGSNLGNPARNVERALTALETLGSVVAASARYRTKAWGEADQPDFVNAVALLETALDPHALLAALQRIEREFGRTPSYRWGPRTLDLDILTYAGAACNDDDLVLPHPRFLERAFVLAPLAEIAPEYALALHALPPAERQSVQRIRPSAARTVGAVDWQESLERVRSAAAFCASAGLARLRIEEEHFALEIRRTPGVAPVPEPAVPDHANGVVANASPNGVPASAGRPAEVLRAEFVGIVRLSRPSVHDGSILAEDRELAYVESLGIRNPVRSGGPGRIAQIFVDDGDAVEFGQPLFALET